MDLIVSEKAIAGENIAQLLADGKVKTKSVSGAKVFEFNWKGREILLVPLRGHISDVEYPKQYANWRGVDVRELINPEIIIYSEKEFQIIQALKELAAEAENIIIATDADREGESIGLEAISYATSTNSKIKIQRAYFSAIAKEDIDKSFNALEKFDYNFAYSANARREIDLIWGAVLTRFLSIVSGQIGKDFLSVGRVQSPTLALIVDREKERLAFKPQSYWEIIAFCEKDKMEFTAMHQEEKFWDKEKALAVFNKQPKSAVVKKIDKKVRVIKKPVPFNTTEFIRAATAIGFSAGKAMDIAETLYQKGFTSYPRTDNSTYPASLNLKDVLNKLVSVKAIMDDVLKVLKLKELVPSAGKFAKDHPPIYPVTPVQKEVLALDEWRIYELICRRFLATLSEDARTENTSALLDASGEPFVAKGQIVLHAGWKEVYPYSELNETILPKLSEGDAVKINKLEMNGKETQPPGRYSQGSLIKLMEENNLGTKCLLPDVEVMVSSGGSICKKNMLDLFNSFPKQKEKGIDLGLNGSVECFSLMGVSVLPQKFAFVSKRKIKKNERVLELVFDDGSLIKCTSEHPLLVWDERFSFVPAEKISKGTLVASSSFFDKQLSKPFGRGRIINSASIYDKLYGVQEKDALVGFRKQKKLSQQAFADLVGANQSSVCMWEQTGYVPLAVLFKIGRVPSLVCGVNKKVILSGFFDRPFSSSLARVLANLICDGSIDKNKIFAEKCFDFRYHNTNLDLINRFVLDIETICGFKGKVCLKKNYAKKQSYYVRLPAVLGKLLATEFPEILSKDIPIIPRDFYADFIGAYFDDEGHAYKDSQKAFFSNTNHNALHALKGMLSLLGIKSAVNENQHKLMVYGINALPLLLEKIPIFSVDKKQRLIDALSTMYKYSFSKEPQLLFEKKLLFELSMRTQSSADLASLFGVTEACIVNRIRRLRKLGLVNKIVEGNNVQRIRAIKYSSEQFSSSFYSLLGETVLAPSIVSKKVAFVREIPYTGFVYDLTIGKKFSNFVLGNNILVHNSTRPAIIQKLYSRRYISGNKSIEPSRVAFAVIDSLEKHCETVTKPEMTSDLEKEMDEIAAGKRKQREVVDKSCTDLKQIMELLFKHKESVAIELRTALRFSEVMGKCSCGANLVVRRGKSGKRFVGCSSYPNCTITYPLPQKGFITPLNEYCPECKAPTIQVKNGRFNYKMCLNMVCVTKKDWIKKAQEKKEAVQAKEAVGKQIESKSSESKLAETNKANEKVIETKFGSVPSFPGPAVAPVIKVSIPEVALNLDSSKKVSLKKEVKPRIVKKEPKPKKSKVKKVESVVVKGKAK